ncbi:hypothetical protein QYE76_049466 [Lolium multiflorum]|uniref:Retrovirus-related Pol polyprotein from transposon TNT 1-94-like beta-barrel domain-containing protein n=1 Tax=Lolium multiflorum TaxID=4521 RepID=A0AAD8SPQ0_LOLMU|nr:hypothetical protein QYE76_049466 [Lolium multiflorum]
MPIAGRLVRDIVAQGKLKLDYTTRFSLWQEKMRAILTQSSDLDEALDGLDKKDAKTWTDDEKRKDPALWLKLESICMSKDLTSKMHVKMKLFSHKLQEGASMMNHLSIFREIVPDVLSMERIRHLRQKNCRSEAAPRTETTTTTTTTEIRARPTEVAQSPRDEMSGDVVRMGDNNPCEIAGIGSVQIKMHDAMTQTLTDVRHIPGMARNLISLSTLDVDWYKHSGSRGVLKRFVRHHTIPYTPQQNGVAERMNITIISKACCMLSNVDVTNAVDFFDNTDDEQQRISVQVEHVEEKEIDVAENDNTVVQHSPHVEHDTEPATYTEAVASVDRMKWISAMEEEMQSLDKNGTWDVVPLPKQKKVVRCKWIFKRKEGLSRNEPPRFKVRSTGDGSMELSSPSAVHWSDLPDDLLGLVHSKVASLRGRVRFAAICRSWRAAVSLHPAPPALPLLLLSLCDWRTTEERSRRLYCPEDDSVLGVQLPSRLKLNSASWINGSYVSGWIATSPIVSTNLSPIMILNLFSGA